MPEVPAHPGEKEVSPHEGRREFSPLRTEAQRFASLGLSESGKNQETRIKMAKRNGNGRAGLCFKFAFEHILRQQEGTLVHGRVWSRALGRAIDHAWVVTETGFVYEPVADRYFEKDELYRAYQMKEIAVYTVEEAMRMAAQAKHYGPWSETRRGTKKGEGDESTTPKPPQILPSEFTKPPFTLLDKVGERI